MNPIARYLARLAAVGGIEHSPHRGRSGRTAAGATVARGVLLLVVVGLGAGCVKHLGEESLHRDRLGQVTDDCVVPRPEELASWGAPIGLEYPSLSLWIWNEVETREGTALRLVAARVASRADACNDALEWHRGEGGALEPILVLTPQEVADNASRTDGTRWELSATGGFVHAGRGYLYYEKILAGPGLFDALSVGTGVCLIEVGDTVCERTQPETVPNEPTLLFGAGVRRPNQGGLLWSDGYAYLYGCLRAAAFTDLCGLWRVPPDDATDPRAYEVRGSFGSWTTDPAGAEILFESSGAVTAATNAELGELVVVTANLWDATLEARLGHAPWGPLDPPERLAALVAPTEWFVDGGRLHAGLGEESGKVMTFSYYTSAEGEAEGLHLIAFRLGN